MRLFVAANLDNVLRDEVHAGAARLRDAAPGVAWVRRELLHMTLKFVGEQEASRVADFSRSLSALSAAAEPIDIRIHGYGAFPNFREPRVVWIGGDLPPRLSALAAAVDEACAGYGVEPEQRPFRAHITLGRVRRPLPREERRQLEQAAQGRHEVLHWHVESVELMSSELGPSGPTYTVVESFALGGAPHTR